MSYEYLIIAGLLVAIMDIDRFKRHDSWLYRIGWVVIWANFKEKRLFWPLDLWHVAKMAAVFFLCRAFVGWWDAALATTIVLGVFTSGYHFVWRLVPFRAAWTYIRKLPRRKQDAFVE